MILFYLFQFEIVNPLSYLLDYVVLSAEDIDADLFVGFLLDKVVFDQFLRLFNYVTFVLLNLGHCFLFSIFLLLTIVVIIVGSRPSFFDFGQVICPGVLFFV